MRLVYLLFCLIFHLFMSYSRRQLVRHFGVFYMHGTGDAIMKKKMSTRILKSAVLTCIPGVTFFFICLMSNFNNVDL